MATTVAYSGNINSIASLYPNYTYTLTFPGPRLRCGDVTNQTAFDLARINATLDSRLWYNTSAKPSGYDIVPDSSYDILSGVRAYNFTCEMWNTTYTARFSFVNGQQTTSVTELQYEHRFAPEKTCGYDSASCAYKSWRDSIIGVPAGSWEVAPPPYWGYFVSTRILQDTLVQCRGLLGNDTTCPEPSLAKAVERMSENVTLSHFGSLPEM